MTRRAVILGLLVVVIGLFAPETRAQPSPSTARVPYRRSSMGLVTAPAGSVLLFGGDFYDRNQQVHYLNDTWRWDGTAWMELYPAKAPSPRCCFAFAYDEARQEVVLYGGCDGDYLGDTWTWNGSTWTRRFPPASPPASCGQVAAYDPVLQRVVMFGGEGIADTWTWDGSTWTKYHPTIQPFGRERQGMTFDPVHRQIVMFGGEYPCFDWECYLHDTWVLHGTRWKQQWPATVPPNATRMGLAFDQARGEIVMFGGSACCSFRGKTWTSHGTDWYEERPPRPPDPREALGMTWDPTRQEVLLFGGRHTIDYDWHDFGDTWVWDGSMWICVAACS